MKSRDVARGDLEERTRHRPRAQSRTNIKAVLSWRSTPPPKQALPAMPVPAIRHLTLSLIER